MPKPSNADRTYQLGPDGTLTVREDSPAGSRQWDIPPSQIEPHARIMESGQAWDDVPPGVKSAARDAANEAKRAAQAADQLAREMARDAGV